MQGLWHLEEAGSDLMSDTQEFSESKKRAIERGRLWLEEFKKRSQEEQIEYMAAEIYASVALDPYGYPNGRRRWDELPEIDNDHTAARSGKYLLVQDKYRYRQAAQMAYRIAQWMEPDR